MKEDMQRYGNQESKCKQNNTYDDIWKCNSKCNHKCSGKWKTQTVLLACIAFVLAGGMGGGITYFLTERWEIAGTGEEAGQRGITGITDNGAEKEYILYIGLNDKDEYRQLVSTEEAEEIISGICIRYAGGYTMTRAEGGWVDQKGKLTSEQTLVYTVRGKEEDIIKIMDDILPALNQDSVLLEEKNTGSMYYSGIREEREGFHDENGK